MEKKKLKIGVMGARMGGSHARCFSVLMDDAEVVAICEQNEDIWDSLKKDLSPETKFYKDFDEFIHSGIDAVVLGNYFHEHAKYAIKAFEAGVDVLSETTAAPTLADCVALVEAYEKYGRKYALAVNCCYFEAVYNMRNTLRSGKAGKIFFAEAEYNHPPEGPGAPINPENLHWRQTLPGSYYNMHTLGALMYATDSMPKTVWAKTMTPNNYQRPNKLINSVGAIVITGMDNGAVYKTTGCLPFEPFSKWYRINCENMCLETERYEWREERYIEAHPKCRIQNTHPGAEAIGLDNEEIQQIKKKAANMPAEYAHGHGGIDFYNKYHFVKYLNGEEESEFDVYRAAALSAAGILGWYSELTGKEFRIPDFRNPEDREKVRYDTRSPFGKTEAEITLPFRIEDKDKFDLYDPQYKFGL